MRVCTSLPAKLDPEPFSCGRRQRRNCNVGRTGKPRPGPLKKGRRATKPTANPHDGLSQDLGHAWGPPARPRARARTRLGWYERIPLYPRVCAFGRREGHDVELPFPVIGKGTGLRFRGNDQVAQKGWAIGCTAYVVCLFSYLRFGCCARLSLAFCGRANLDSEDAALSRRFNSSCWIYWLVNIDQEKWPLGHHYKGGSR